MDTVTGRKVSIQKINHVFDDLIAARRILREIKLSAHFQHEHIVGLRDLIAPWNHTKFDHIYIVSGYMETNLYKIIYSKNELTDEHVQYFLYQILNGLKHIHSAGVIHFALHPENILLNGNCDLKICDFSSARAVHQPPDDDDDVDRRWYRAPEMLCGVQEYDTSIDVWSVCI
jgi:serine/threonine protein kinase